MLIHGYKLAVNFDPKQLARRISTVVGLILLTACGSTTPHWGYQGIESPDRWAELSENYEICRKGSHQSPIDLRDIELTIEQNLITAYLPTQAHVVNNGHTVQFDMDEDNFIAVDDKRYRLLQLHFHAGSEHTIDGVRSPAEMHLVHRAQNGDLAVIALLIEVGDSNIYGNIFDRIPNIGEQIKVTLPLEKFIPTDRERFTYSGSLTTPPCSEQVLWLVFHKHIRIPQQQLSKFKAFYSHNYRPTQKTYNRKVVRAR